ERDAVLPAHAVRGTTRASRRVPAVAPRDRPAVALVVATSDVRTEIALLRPQVVQEVGVLPLRDLVLHDPERLGSLPVRRRHRAEAIALVFGMRRAIVDLARLGSDRDCAFVGDLERTGGGPVGSDPVESAEVERGGIGIADPEGAAGNPN